MIITWAEKVCKGGGGGEQNLVEPIFVVTKPISKKEITFTDMAGVRGFILDEHGLI